jgi:hypothetical protein
MGKQERLLELVLERIGGDSVPDAARRIGMTDYGSPQKLRRWRSGRHEPKLADAMMLLARAGLLQAEAVAAWEGISLKEARQRVEQRRRAVGAGEAGEARAALRAARESAEARPRAPKRRRRSA